MTAPAALYTTRTSHRDATRTRDHKVECPHLPIRVPQVLEKRSRSPFRSVHTYTLTTDHPDVGDVAICEIGCGAGNTAFTLLIVIKNPKLMIRALDYSSLAVMLVQFGP